MMAGSSLSPVSSTDRSAISNDHCADVRLRWISLRHALLAEVDRYAHPSPEFSGVVHETIISLDRCTVAGTWHLAHMFAIESSRFIPVEVVDQQPPSGSAGVVGIGQRLHNILFVSLDTGSELRFQLWSRLGSNQ